MRRPCHRPDRSKTGDYAASRYAPLISRPKCPGAAAMVCSRLSGTLPSSASTVDLTEQEVFEASLRSFRVFYRKTPELRSQQQRFAPRKPAAARSGICRARTGGLDGVIRNMQQPQSVG